MSRNFLPVALAIGVGVFTGYYTFQPTFQRMAIEKAHGGQAHPPATSANEAKAPAEEAPAKLSPTDPKSKVDKSK